MGETTGRMYLFKDTCRIYYSRIHVIMDETTGRIYYSRIHVIMGETTGRMYYSIIHVGYTIQSYM
jgi:hypothetical protein